MSDGEDARNEVLRAGAADPRGSSETTASWCSRVPTVTIAAAVLGAAAIGGLGVWLYLRAGASPQNRASHRIEELRHRLNELADQLARHTQGEGEQGGAARNA